MSLDSHVAAWFEIPVSNMERAIKFYESVFKYKLELHSMGPLDMALFPSPDDKNAPGVGGSLVCHQEFYKPSNDGCLIYFMSPTGDLNNELSRVEKAGGKVLSEKKQISPDVGYMALFLDTENNRIALHSVN